MKKIISTCITLMVSAACSISAFAMEVPTNTTIQDLNGVRQYIKIYTVAPDTDPQSLIDDVFEYDGYTYTYGNTLASLSMISARKTPPTSLTPAHRLLCRPS